MIKLLYLYAMLPTDLYCHIYDANTGKMLHGDGVKGWSAPFQVDFGDYEVVKIEAKSIETDRVILRIEVVEI